ncbi:MAG: hypothetical protein AMXMBFR6_10970 [Betaproteobacteria bacterium]
MIGVVSRALAAHVRNGDRIVLGLSGGLDSIVLADVTTRVADTFGLSVSALHVHHGLHANADDWAAFCETWCASRRLPCRIVRVRVPRDAADGPEAAARRVRFHAYRQCDADWIVLGHHADDQAETILHRLLRGAGPSGLSGMPTSRPLAADTRTRLLRPLLEVPRAHLLEYARAHGLSWVEDPSNRDTYYLRNFLRHEVLPLLESRFPGARAALLRAAGLARSAEDLLDRQATEDLARISRDDGWSASALISLPPERAVGLLRKLLREQGSSLPSQARMLEIYRQLSRVCAGGGLRVVVGEVCLYRYRDDLWIERTSSAQATMGQQHAAVVWQGEAALRWRRGSLELKESLGTGLSRAHIAPLGLRLESRRGGETLQVRAHGPHRSLKNLFQEAGIPAWLREDIPLVWSGASLVAVPGIAIAHAFAARADEPGLELNWRYGAHVPGARQ